MRERRRDVFVAHRRVGEIDEVAFEAGLGRPAEVENDLNNLFEITEADSACRMVSGKMSRSCVSSQLGSKDSALTANFHPQL